jgi:uncharacterized membrane protein (DUF4010 family)
LVSSTAVTAELARRTAREPQAAFKTLAGIVLASSMMFLRMLVLIAVIAPDVAQALVLPMAAAGIVGFILGAVALWRARGSLAPPVELRNPLDLPLALKFGLFVAAVMALNRWLVATYGNTLLFTGAAAAGLADVDAITVSLGRLAEEGLIGGRDAATGVLVAAGANLLSKATLSLAIGTRCLGVRVWVAFCLMLGAALAVKMGIRV